MFEQLVRPFQSRQIGTTRRIVPAVKTDDKPDEAKIIWGTVGELAREVVQPKGVNLENIESVGFNVRGNIDNWNQTSREGELVDIPIRDNDGNQIGATTVDRTKEIEYTKRLAPYDWEKNPSNPYFPNYDGVARVQPGQVNFTGTKSDLIRSYPGLRDQVPGADTDKATYKFQWATFT